MNDATSVALLNTVGLLSESARFDSSTCLFILLFFIYLFVTSCALGLGAGLGIATIMKRLGPFSEPQVRALPSTPARARTRRAGGLASVFIR